MTISFCFCGLATLLLLLICGLIDTRKQCQEQPTWRRQKLQLQQEQQQQQLTIVFSVVVSWHSFSTSFSTSFSPTHTHTLAGHVLVSLSVCLHVLLSVTHTHSIHFKCHTPFAARLQSDLLGSRCVWVMSFSTHFRRGLTGVCVCESCLVKGCTLAVKFSSTSSCRNFTTFALSLAFLYSKFFTFLPPPSPL